MWDRPARPVRNQAPSSHLLFQGAAPDPSVHSRGLHPDCAPRVTSGNILGCHNQSIWWVETGMPPATGQLRTANAQPASQRHAAGESLAHTQRAPRVPTRRRHRLVWHRPCSEHA